MVILPTITITNNKIITVNTIFAFTFLLDLNRDMLEPFLKHAL